MASTVACVLIVVVIAVTTLTPLGEGPEGASGDRCALGLPCTLGHFVLFGALGVALGVRYATSGAARRSPRRVLMALLLSMWLFAALDELAQDWVGRDAQLGDWMADMAGALLGIFGGSALLRWLWRPPSARSP